MVKTSQIPAHFSHPMDIPASLWFHENLSYPKTSTYATATSFYSRCDCTIRQASLPNNVACTFHSSKKLEQSCRLRATSVVQLVVMLMTQAVCLAGWDYSQLLMPPITVCIYRYTRQSWNKPWQYVQCHRSNKQQQYLNSHSTLTLSGWSSNFSSSVNVGFIPSAIYSAHTQNHAIAVVMAADPVKCILGRETKAKNQLWSHWNIIFETCAANPTPPPKLSCGS